MFVELEVHTPGADPCADDSGPVERGDDGAADGSVRTKVPVYRSWSYWREY